MHFDPREQAALRDAGLSADDVEAVSEAVVDATRTEADRLAAFFDRGTVHSDMDRAHSTDDVHEHTVEFVDLFTHADEIRGYLRFDSWGVWVAGGPVLRSGPGGPDLVELRLGPTVNGRVRFAADPQEL